MYWRSVDWATSSSPVVGDQDGSVFNAKELVVGEFILLRMAGFFGGDVLLSLF